jgi:hypothetical protein
MKLPIDLHIPSQALGKPVAGTVCLLLLATTTSKLLA